MRLVDGVEQVDSLSLMGIGISGSKFPYLYRKESTKSTWSTLNGGTYFSNEHRRAGHALWPRLRTSRILALFELSGGF
jgi:hypothetical protein